MTTIDISPNQLFPAAPRGRPYASSSMIYKELKTPDGNASFSIDPWTRRWALLQPPAVALLRLANGRRSLDEIVQALAADPAIDRQAAALLDLANQLAQVGLLYTSQEEHRASGVPVYNKSDMTGIHLEVTNACNLHCAHCYVASGKKMDRELSYDEIIQTIDMLPPFSGKQVVISGGEPTLRKDCVPLLEYCAVECGHNVDLYTNAKRFPEDLAQAILDINRRAAGTVRVQVSLEGATAGTHDLIRGKGSFKAVIKSLEMFQRVRLNAVTVLFICITKHNIHEIDEMIALAEGYGVSALAFSQWQRQGNASNTPWASIAPSVEEWVAAGEKILAYNNPALTLTGNFFGDLNNNEVGRLSLDSPLFPKHIYAYNIFPRITPQGDVFADQLWVDPAWILGNVRQDRLDDCFETSKFYGQLAQMRARTDQIAACRACEWRQLCEAGSPGHTYAEYGHLNEKDLFCESRIYWFNRYVEHQVAKLTNRPQTVTPV